MGSSPEGNEIILIRERHYSFTVLLRNREEIFQYVLHSASQTRTEILEDEVGVLF